MDLFMRRSFCATILVVTFLYSLQHCTAADNEVDPTPTVTEDTITDGAQTTVGLVQKPKPPPPPPPPPPGPPTIPVSDSVPVGTSSPLQEGQCAVGTRIDNDSDQPIVSAQSDLIYIDVGNPATCSGNVAGWEICYSMSGTGSNSFDLLLLQMESGGRVYNVHTAQRIEIDPSEITEQSHNDITCVYATENENVSISQGDYVGFVCNDDIKTGLIPKADGEKSSIRTFNLTLGFQDQNQQSQNGLTKKQVSNSIGINSIPSDSLMPLNEDLVPQFRIVINESDKVTPSRTKTHPTPCPTNPGGPTTIFTTVFTSVVIASVVVIFVLFIVVFFMGCYICQIKCKCFKRLCRCCRRRRVAHRITVERITDQSMQYNDVYIPQDPRQIISRGKRYRADIQDNPAYETTVANRSSSASFVATPPPPSGMHNLARTLPSQDALSTATELSSLENPPIGSLPGYEGQTTTSTSDSQKSSEMDLEIFEDSRNFDHTYEMIQSGRFVH